MATQSGYSQGSAPGSGGQVGVVGQGTSRASKDEDGYSIDKLRRMYLDFAGAKNDEITEQRTARHYFHGDQLTTAQLKVLEKRKQPAVVRNKIDRKINGVVGLLERLKQDPKAYPRSPNSLPPMQQGGGVMPPQAPPGMPPGMGSQPGMGDNGGPPMGGPDDLQGQPESDLRDEGSDLATATIRYVLDKPNDDGENWNTTAAECGRAGAINGIFGVELQLEKGDHGDPDVSMAIVDAETFFYDPRSVRYSFSDSRYMGVAKWVDLELAQEMFPEKADELESLVSTSNGMETWQQADREFKWVNTTLKRLFLVEHWYIKKGEWRWCIYTGNVEIRKGVSPFADERDKTICRYIMGAVNIDHDGDRYGFVRNLKPLQDELNARASKALHLLNTRRIIMENGAVDDIEKVRIEAVRPDGVIVVNHGKELQFDDEKSARDFAGQLEVFAEVADAIENFGPNPALIGQGIENKSGRAIALLQQAGIAELGPFILSFRGWKIRVYRALWNIVQKYWTSERWIRVTDDDELTKFLALNRLQMNEMGQPFLANHIGALDVDIILDEGPDAITLSQGSFETLQAMAQAGQQVPFEILIELAPDIDTRTKKKLLALAQQAKQGDPQENQVRMAGAVADVKGKEAGAAKDIATARKTMAEIPGEAAKTTKDKAAAFRDITDAAISVHQARNPPPADGARPSDGGLGQFEHP